jgi:hypothetical protein
MVTVYMINKKMMVYPTATTEAAYDRLHQLLPHHHLVRSYGGIPTSRDPRLVYYFVRGATTEQVFEDYKANTELDLIIVHMSCMYTVQLAYLMPQHVQAIVDGHQQVTCATCEDLGKLSFMCRSCGCTQCCDCVFTNRRCIICNEPYVIS